jgi:hypothetical protein
VPRPRLPGLPDALADLERAAVEVVSARQRLDQAVHRCRDLGASWQDCAAASGIPSATLCHRDRPRPVVPQQGVGQVLDDAPATP